MAPITFTARGIPQPQGRPRAFARKFGDKWQARVYNPATAEGWKGIVALAAKPHVPFPPLAGPLQVVLSFTMPRPKGHYRSNGQLKEGAPAWHIARGDFDNYAKAICDAMTQIGMWADDGQVARALVEKRYGPIPGCDVEISRLGTEEAPRTARELLLRLGP